jgi:uncharacterized protein YjbJ (UPF0337 family)
MSNITDRIKGEWNQVKGKIKQQYAELTDDDLKMVEGKRDELIGKIQEKTGKAKSEVTSFIDNL